MQKEAAVLLGKLNANTITLDEVAHLQEVLVGDGTDLVRFFIPKIQETVDRLVKERHIPKKPESPAGTGTQSAAQQAVVEPALAARAASDQFTEDERQYLNRIIQVRDARVDEIRRKIGPAETGNAASRKKKRGSHSTKSESGRAQDQLSDLRAQLADLESGKTVVETALVMPPQSHWKAGCLMQLNAPLEVVQVVGPFDMLAKYAGLNPRFQTFWLHGFTTKNVADDQSLHFDELVVVDGTKMYDTAAGGSRTVFVLRPLVIDREKVLAEYRARSKPAPDATIPAKPLPKHKTDVMPADPDAAALKRFAGVLRNARVLMKGGLRDAAKKDLLQIIKEAPGTVIAKDAQKELDQLDSH